jgi:hypothetical protein
MPKMRETLAAGKAHIPPRLISIAERIALMGVEEKKS